MDYVNSKCCLCGVDIQGNGVSMCNKCLVMNANVSDGIESDATITSCKECHKVLTYSKHWVSVERESVEELGILLKMIKGVKKSELVEARFIWTEPHNRRIIVELDIRKEIQNGVTVIGKTRVTFKQIEQMCPECLKVTQEYTWEAIVQIRQHIRHKRTLLWLEQQIIATRRHSESIGVEIVSGGLDFYFAKKMDANAFVDYLKQKLSKQLHSQDFKNNLTFYRYSSYIEIPPICKVDDLVLLPKACARECAIPLFICIKVASYLYFINATTLKTVSVNALTYGKYPFTSLLSSENLKEFTVLDVQFVDRRYYTQDDPQVDKEKYVLADIEVMRSADFGVKDDTVIVRSHLGNLLHPGDIVMGYDLRSTSINNCDWDKYDESDLPDVVLVYKQKEKKSKPTKKRYRNCGIKEVKENTDVDGKEVEQYEKDREEYMDEEEEIIDMDDVEIVNDDLTDDNMVENVEEEE